MPGPQTQPVQKSRQKPVQGLYARQKAVQRLNEVLKGNPFEPLTAKAISDARDRALANRLITTALRRHGHLNQIIQTLLQRGMPRRSGQFEAILRIALAQLLFLPDMGEHSAIHLAVELSKKDIRTRRFTKVLNGVLRQAQREQEKWRNLDPRNLFPPWLIKAWESDYGTENLQKFAAALVQGAPLDLTVKSPDAQMLSELNATPNFLDSVRIFERDRPVSQLPLYSEGQWWVQDFAATLPARLFDLSPDSTVLDICAAPGGKSAQLIKAGFEVTALDNSPARLKIMNANLQRLNYVAHSIEADATTFSSHQKFDGILIDAPCTATGTFRRHPEVIWQRTEQDCLNRVTLQQKIITNAVKNLKQGGTLILCVCSLMKSEGEGQASWINDNFPQLSPIPIKEIEIANLKDAITKEGWVKTHPGLEMPNEQKGTMDGFFMARWQLH